MVALQSDQMRVEPSASAFCLRLGNTDWNEECPHEPGDDQDGQRGARGPSDRVDERDGTVEEAIRHFEEGGEGRQRKWVMTEVLAVEADGVTVWPRDIRSKAGPLRDRDRPCGSSSARASGGARMLRCGHPAELVAVLASARSDDEFAGSDG